MTASIAKARDGRRVFVGLHGWSGDHCTFDPVRPHVPEDVRLLAFDQPGFGGTAPPLEWDFEHFTEPLLATLEDQGLDKVTLVGNCAGAVIALEMALRQPERFDRLVLIDPFAYVPWYFRLLTWGWPGWFFYHFTFANPAGRWLTNLALRSKRTEDTDLAAGFETVRHDVAFRYLRMLCRGADARRYADLRMPITLLYGTNTFAAVKRSVRIYQRLWPQAEARALAGAGHLPIQEASEALATHTFDDQGGPRWIPSHPPSTRCDWSPSSPV